MKKYLLIATAFILSAGSACAQNAKFETLKPSQQVLQQSNNASLQATPRKAPRKIELGENQLIMGAYTSDALASDGLGLPNNPGTYKVATLLPIEVISMYDGCQVVKMRFGLCEDNQVSSVFIYPIDTEGNIGNAIVEEQVKGGKKGWNEVIFSEPVTISTENISGYLMGFSYVQSNANDGKQYYVECFPLSVVAEGAYTCSSYVYGNLGQGTAWYDIGTEDYGNLSVQAVVEGDFPQYGLMPLDFREVVLLEGETGSIDLNIINAGTEGATSFDYTMTVDGETSEEQTYTFTNPVEDFSAVTIAKIPVVAAPTAKESEVSITITKVDGQENMASTPTANGIVATISEIIPRNVLVEENTGTGCGWCPRGLVGMDIMRQTFGEQFVGVALHWYNSTDPMYFAPSNYAPIDFGGAPSCRINRGEEMDPKYGSNEDDICNDFRTAMKVHSKGGVTVTGTWNKDKKQVVATAIVTPVIDSEYLDVAFVLVADQLSGTTSAWKQSNYYYQYTAAQVGDSDLNMFCKGGTYGTSSISGWKFNDVAIASSYSNYTNQVPSVGFVKAGEQAEVSYTLSLPTKTTLKNAINTDEVYVVAILTDTRNGSVQNAAKVKVSDSSDMTGIANYDVDNTASTANYSLSGMLLTAPQKGVNIVRMADGRVVKTLVR